VMMVGDDLVTHIDEAQVKALFGDAKTGGDQ